MLLKERNYSVLIASASERTAAELSAVLIEPRYGPIRFASDAGSAKRAFGDREYDCVIIDSPLPDDAGLRLAKDMAASRETAVLLLVRAELYEDAYEAVVEHGVFVLSKPLYGPMLSFALGWMESARERLRKLARKTVSVEEKMEEIRVVNRAKWLLITKLGLSEERAHRHIEKQAMDRCMAKRAVAEEIIRRYAGEGIPKDHA